MGIEIGDAGRCRSGLPLPNCGRAMDHLTLQIRVIDHIAIHNADPAHAGRRQIQQQWRAQATTTHTQH